MSARDRRAADALASEAWRHIFDFIAATADQRDRVLERLELTPGDVRALSSLRPGAGRTMTALAERWKLDASTATWLVDRLERRGFVERRASPTDRRAKLVVLTKAGARTKAQLEAGLYAPPPELRGLREEDLRVLRDATAKLPAGPWPVSSGAVRLERRPPKKR